MSQLPELTPFQNEVRSRWAAQFPALGVDTLEASRVTRELSDLVITCRDQPRQPEVLLEWSADRGLVVSAVARDGGHLTGCEIVWAGPIPPHLAKPFEGVQPFTSPRVLTAGVHGTVASKAVPRTYISLRTAAQLLAFLSDPAPDIQLHPLNTSEGTHAAWACRRLPWSRCLLALHNFDRQLAALDVAAGWLMAIQNGTWHADVVAPPSGQPRPVSLLTLTEIPDRDLERAEHLHIMPIIVGAGLTFGPQINATIERIDYALPSLNELVDMVQATFDEVLIADNLRRTLPADERLTIASTLLGLTEMQATNALTRLVSDHYADPVSEAATRMLEQSRCQMLRGANLTFIPRSELPPVESVADAENVFQWLARAKLAMSPAGRAAQLDLPRGCAFVGIPGTAKSLLAEAAARALGVPCVELNLGDLMGQYVGQSESAMRVCLSVIRGIGACVVRIDEADKGLAGNSAGAAATDSGVTRRMFGMLLSAMADQHTAGTIWVFTLNNIDALPAELFRPGRVDRIFVFDTPGRQARRDILAIHLRKRGEDPDTILQPGPDLERLLDMTDQMVGAEIERIVAEARTTACMQESGPLQLSHLLTEAGPLSQKKLANAAPAELARMREFAAARGTPASAATVVSTDVAAVLDHVGAARRSRRRASVDTPGDSPKPSAN